MQQNKNIKIFFNYFLGPVLFVWLLFSIYQQVTQQAHLSTSWLHIRQSLQSYKVWIIGAVILLMSINWGIEAVKWKLSVAAVQPLSFVQAFKAVLSGVSFSVSLPNRVGEYAGRALYMPDGQRLQAIAITFVGGISQLLVTLLLGLAGLFLLKEKLLHSAQVTEVGFQWLVAGVTTATVVLTLLYFGVGRTGQWLDRRLKKWRYGHLLQSLKTFNVQLLLLLLLLSFLRYIVFVSQYILLFALFNVHVSALVVWCVVSVLFLAMAVIPTIALVEVGLRGKISLQLMGLFTANSLGIALTSVTIWFINLIVPALIGSMLILSIKVFKRKNETL